MNKEKANLRLVIREWKLLTDEAKRKSAKQLMAESQARITEMTQSRDRLEAERAQTEEKIKELRRDLETSRQELAELDAAAIGCSVLAESKETELMAAAKAWAELCDVAASSQLATLRAELMGYEEDSFGDISLLVNKPKILSAAVSMWSLAPCLLSGGGEGGSGRPGPVDPQCPLYAMRPAAAALGQLSPARSGMFQGGREPAIRHRRLRGTRHRDSRMLTAQWISHETRPIAER